MPQPGLMKMRITHISMNCLSSDVVSIAFAYCLNSARASLKYGIQCLLIQKPQNNQKLILVTHLIPFEFSLTLENK
jgi:hypothetical protein